MKPKIQYDIYECKEYFEKETKKIKNGLVKQVENNKMSPETAREKLDMYLSMLVFLGVCVKWAEDEKFLNGNEFSFHALYSIGEQSSKGDQKLKEAVKNL